MKTWKYQRKSKIQMMEEASTRSKKNNIIIFWSLNKNPEDPWINESINREQDSQQVPLHPAPSHLRKLRSTICQVAAALRSLSGWLLSKGSPLLHACNPQRKTDSELKSLCHPFLGENEESIAKLQSRTINQAHFSTKARAWVFLTTAALPLFASS